MNEKVSKNKVFVGMSGGVDSSVSAALLQKSGYQVTGVFIKVWQPDWMECTWKEDRLDAMRVCAQLGIPFKTLDLEKEYKRDVVDYMISEYKAGRTPNPDVMCNRSVKFGGFLKWALEQGADYVATGHYAQNIEGQLTEAVDQDKDQTYFLWTLTQKQLQHILFPIGHLKKTEVRKLAGKFGLATAAKKDSQGLCFIGKVDLKEFLGHYIDAKPGKVLGEEGNEIGEHDGAFFYTIGQRHGFLVHEKNTFRKPYYIVRKDIEKNTLTVSEKDTENSPKSDAGTITTLANTSWTNLAPKSAANLTAKIRYRQPHQIITSLNHKKAFTTLVFKDQQTAPSPGQSVVLYSNGTCVGGGIIDTIEG